MINKLNRIKSRLLVEYHRVKYRKSVLGAHMGIRGNLSIMGPGKVVIGQHCSFDNATGRPNKLQTFDSTATITIGDHCYMNGIEIASKSSVSIGDRCIIADCLIMDTDFHSIEVDRHSKDAVVKTKAIIISNNVWLGNRVIVLKGVHIGENAVVGAGTVVRQSIPANAVVIGNPQQIVKMLK